MIHFLVPAAQGVGIKDYLDLFGKSLRDDIRILHYEDLARQREFVRGTYVLSALDQLNPAMAQLLFEIHQQLKQIDGIRFLNDPRKTLQRFELVFDVHAAQVDTVTLRRIIPECVVEHFGKHR